MSKKFWLPIFSAILIAAIAAASLPFNALAQGGGGGALRDRLRRTRQAVGQVTAVSATAISLDTVKRGALSFSIDDDTRVRHVDGSAASLSDVQVGDWVRVAPVLGGQKGDGKTQPAARAIVLLPDDFDPTTIKGGRGKVTAVDAANSRFKIETRAGETVTVVVNSATTYKGEAASLAELKVGMTAGVIAQKQAGGELLATAVRADWARVRRVGEVSAVDAAAHRFTLKTRRDGTEITVTVDGKTRFRSKGGALDAFEDLKPGMPIAIQGQEQPNGTTLARVVLALPQQ